MLGWWKNLLFYDNCSWTPKKVCENDHCNLKIGGLYFKYWSAICNAVFYDLWFIYFRGARAPCGGTARSTTRYGILSDVSLFPFLFKRCCWYTSWNNSVKSRIPERGGLIIPKFKKKLFRVFVSWAEVMGNRHQTESSTYLLS